MDGPIYEWVLNAHEAAVAVLQMYPISTKIDIKTQPYPHYQIWNQ